MAFIHKRFGQMEPILQSGPNTHQPACLPVSLLREFPTDVLSRISHSLYSLYAQKLIQPTTSAIKQTTVMLPIDSYIQPGAYT